MQILRTLLAAAAAFALAQSAHSTGFTGNWIRLAHNYPAPGVVYGSFQDAVVGPGVEGDSLLIYYTVDVSEGIVRVNFPRSGTFDSSGFNGLQVNDIYNSIPDFSSANLTGTNIPALDTSRITFDADNLFIDFGGLNPSGGEFIEVGISLVPEPSTNALAVVGAILLACAKRKRTKVVALVQRTDA